MTVHHKRIALISAVIVAAALTWFTARVWLSVPKPFSDWTGMIAPGLAVVLLGAITGVAAMFLDRHMEQVAVVLGSWATFVLFWPGNIYYLSALPVFAILWWYGKRAIEDDLSDRRQVRVRATLTLGMKYLIFGAFLMVSLGFYLTPHAQNANTRTVSQSVQNSIDRAYQNEFVQNQLSSLPEGARAQARQDLAIAVDRFIRNWLGPIAEWIPPILALALFLVLWSVSFIFREAAILLGVGIFTLLRRFGFVRIETAKVDAQVATL